MATTAIKCISRAGGLVDGPVGSSLFYIANKKKPSQPYPVLCNVSKCNFVCYSDKSDQFKAFKIYILNASAYYLKVRRRYIELVNRRSCSKNLLSNIVNLSREKNAGKKKKTKSTQTRRGPANVIPCKITKPVNATHQPPTPVLPDPPSSRYIATLLKFVHQNVSSCYGYNGKFYEHGCPSLPNNLVVVSKTQRVFYNQITKERTRCNEMKIIFQLYLCAFTRPVLCTQLINVESDVKPWLEEKHVAFLPSCGIDL